jgi:two-component system, LuxR family, sensor kinase FixL
LSPPVDDAADRPRTAHLLGPSIDARLRLATIVLSLAAYLALEWLSFLHEFEGLPVTPWNPGLGVLFGLLLLWGPSYGALLFAGVVLAEIFVLQTRLGWPVVLAIAFTIAGVYTAAAAGMRSMLDFDVRVDRLRDLGVLLVCSSLAALLVGLMLSAVLFFDAEAGLSEIVAAAFQLVVGDVIGIAVMTPLVLRLGHLEAADLARFRRRASAIELVLLFATLGGAIWIVTGFVTDSEFQYFYILFIPVVAVAVRLGFDSACLALAAVQFSLVADLHAVDADIRAFTEFQALMFVLTATGLVVGAAVSERSRAQGRLQALENKAVRESRLTIVSSITSALAHELNQPMTAARALMRSAQMLIAAPEPDLARAGMNLGNAILQIDYAAAVLRRVREFVKRGRPAAGIIDVHELLEETVLLTRAEAIAGHVGIEVDVPEGGMVMTGDRTQLQQVLLNLVRNAIDEVSHTPEPIVRITVRASPDAVEFRVWDNGPGLPEEIRERLFEPLRSSKREGLGLGLAICWAIVEAHGGRILVHESVPGSTEFRFTIPLQQDQKT